MQEGNYYLMDNEHVLIGYGSVPTIKEFDADGNTVMTVEFGTNLTSSYRAYRHEWHATPYYPPKTVANKASGRTTVYMSWNGATDYDGWKIFAGNAQDELSEVATVAKNGFETMTSLDKVYGFVVVEATQGGQGLRNSTVATVA